MKTEMTNSYHFNPTKVQMITEINAALTERYNGIPTNLTNKVSSLPKERIARLHYFLYLWRHDEWHGEKCSLFDGYCDDEIEANRK